MNKYENIFWVIAYGCGGSIHSSQLYRWISAEGKELKYSTYHAVLSDWERLQLIRKSAIGRNSILFLGQAVYQYFNLAFGGNRSASKLKRTSLIIEKYLIQEGYHLKPPSALRSRLMKTGGLYMLPKGEAQLRILENYKNALEPFQWDLNGIQYEIETMKQYMNISASKRHFSKVSTHFNSSRMNLYRLTFHSIFVSGATLKKNEEKLVFTLYVDLYKIFNSSDKYLSKQILEINHLINAIFFDANNSNHQVNCIITVYSHEKEDEKLADMVYKRLSKTSEFGLYDKASFKRQIRFVFFDTSRRLFGGIKTDSVV